MTHGRSLFRLITMALAMLIVGAGLTIAQSTASIAAPVTLQPGELVVNGGAEQPLAPAWAGSLNRKTHGSGGYPGSLIVDSSGATGATFAGGSALFTGVGGSSVATQTVSLVSSSAAIDNGRVNAQLSVYIGGYGTQNDNAQVRYDFRDGGGTVLGSVNFGPVLAVDRGQISGFIHFSQTQALPIGTREAVITITTARFIAPANDGYVDNVSLILDAPTPVANPDTANTLQNTPVTLDPSSNDTPGAGAAIVPSSIRLLNGSSSLVTTLTSADGTYIVNTATGQVEFAPVSTFYGTSTPVPYRVTDSSGQTADSTMTITVTAVAAPALSLAKSASPSDPANFALGTTVTYSFVVTNTGNVTVDGISITEVAFSGSDPLPAPTCPLTTLAPGQQTVCTTDYTLTATDIAALGVTNTATASGLRDGSVVQVVSDPSSFSVPVIAAPAITLTKSVDDNGATAVGDQVNYSFLVTNTGNVGVTAITIQETTFSGTGTVPSAVCPAGPLAPGQSAVCTASYTLTQADVDTGIVTNTATASATPASGGNTDSGPSSASVTITATPAFTFAKMADRASITAEGQAVLYTFRIVNTGNVTLSSPVINDIAFSGTGTLSPITCATSSVAPAGTLDCTANYTTTAADLEEATLSNSASAEISDPSATTLTSAVTIVAIPIILPDPAASDPAHPATPTGMLGTTGVDPTAPALLAGGLLVAGTILLGLGMGLSRRQRRRSAR